MREIEIRDRRRSGEIQDFTRCDRCFSEVYRGEYCYRLENLVLCEQCLPELKRQWPAPLRRRWEQGGWQ